MRNETIKSDKKQEKLDHAVKAMLSLGAVPEAVDTPKPTLKDKDRRFRLKTRKGKTKLVEVEC